ncbi:phage major capsid protein [Aeromonas veronii]|uniref:phage major capsid protein n=1 Tax=Aeromonas veronii TaxID=654 RepID=UPI003D1D2FF2
MEITQKVEEVLNVVKSQADQIDELRGALEAVKSAPVAQGEVDHKAEARKAFNAALRNKETTQLIKAGKAMTVTDNASAGALTVTEVSRDIVESLIEDYAIPKLFGYETSGSTKLERRVLRGRSGARWEGENINATNGDHTDTPTFETISMTHGKAVAKPVVTQESLTDPWFDVQSYLLKDVRNQMGRLISEGLLTGKGAAQPRGFYTYFNAEEGVKPASERKVDHFAVIRADIAEDVAFLDALQDMTFALKSGYRSGAKFIMTEKLFRRVAGLKDGMGRPMMQASLDAAVAGRIFGYDIIVDVHASEEVPVVFGRLDEAFKIVSIPTTLDFIPNPYKIDFCVEYTIAQRIGTMVYDHEAVVGLMVGAAGRKAK